MIFFSHKENKRIILAYYYYKKPLRVTQFLFLTLTLIASYSLTSGHTSHHILYISRFHITPYCKVFNIHPKWCQGLVNPCAQISVRRHRSKVPHGTKYWTFGSGTCISRPAVVLQSYVLFHLQINHSMMLLPGECM